ncbi:MAG: hypothetical protein ACODAD_04995 [Planctomycetota bacterium]
MDFRNLMATNRSRWAATLILLLAAAMVSGLMASAAPAESKGRGQTTQPRLKSGSERALPILRDIKTTLDRIDARLERLEKCATKVAEQ